MNYLFAECSSIKEAKTHIELLCADSQANRGRAENWRLQGIRRCIKVLNVDASFADRGAIIRELVRLSDGFTTLPIEGLGIAEQDFPRLRRFGLEVRKTSGNKVTVLAVDDNLLAGAVKDALRLDPFSRRPYRPELGDCVLRRLTSFLDYQTATQKSAVRALLTMPSASTLSVTMPTGSGKSLLFQLGALWWRLSYQWACVIVIVPTIALAHDHERTLRTISGLERSRALTSDLNAEQRAQVLFDFNRGDVPILLLSPELALGGARDALFTAAMATLNKPSAAKGRLAAIFIDEAHIVESWGRSFRPDFQRLPGLLAKLSEANPEIRVVLLSATISDQARIELRRAYGHDREILEIDAQMPRYELDIVSLPQETGADRDAAIVKLIDRIPRPCIIYTTRVKHAREVYEGLQEKGYSRIELFTGEITDGGKRGQIINAWSQDALDIVVGTSAFGLGIDKQDVRAVIHACIPESPSRFYQEIGRASRDGFQGLSLCVWSRGSINGQVDDDVVLAYRQATKGWLGVTLSLDRWWAMVKKTIAEGGSKSIEPSIIHDITKV